MGALAFGFDLTTDFAAGDFLSGFRSVGLGLAVVLGFRGTGLGLATGSALAFRGAGLGLAGGDFRGVGLGLLVRGARGLALCFAGLGLFALGFNGQVALFAPSAPHTLHTPPPYCVLDDIYLCLMFLCL